MRISNIGFTMKVIAIVMLIPESCMKIDEKLVLNLNTIS